MSSAGKPASAHDLTRVRVGFAEIVRLRRAALLRGLLKRPALIILDGVASGAGAESDGIREAIRAEMADRTVVMSIADIDAARACDHVISVGSDGTTKEGAPASMLESA